MAVDVVAERAAVALEVFYGESGVPVLGVGEVFPGRAGT